MRASINLIAEILEGERFPVEKLLLPAALSLPLLLLLLATAWEALNGQALARQLQQLTVQRDALTQEVVRLSQEVASFQQQETTEREQAEKKQIAAQGLLKDRILWSEVFREVSFVVPPGVWLTSIETSEPGLSAGSGGPSGTLSVQVGPGPKPLQPMEGKQVKFIGFGKSNAAVTVLLAALERSEHFMDIALVYAQRGAEQDSPQVDFEVTANLRTARF